MASIGWVIFILIILCLLALAIMSDFKAGPTERVEDSRLGVSIVDFSGVVIDKLLMNPNFAQKDGATHGAVTKFYMKQVQRTPTQTKISSIIDANKDNIATLNVHSFEPINLNYTRQECMEAPLQMMHRFNISILGIQEFPIKLADKFIEVLRAFSVKHQIPIYHTIDDFELALRDSKESIANIVISKYPIIKERKVILPSEPEWIFRHRNAVFFRVPEHPTLGSKLFCLTHLEVGSYANNKEKENANIRGRKNQIHEIFNYDNKGPDIIMGDLNFRPGDANKGPEWSLLASKYKIDSGGVDYTIPDYMNTGDETGQNIVDYIWFRKNDATASWSIQTYSVNYPWSDHRPVIGVYSP
jgi:endonuclease/exonuclease/phosphatase family metal-dependent hydrolase